MKLNNRSNKFHTKLQDTKSNVEYTLGSAYNRKVFFCEAQFLSLTSMLKRFDETEYRSKRLGSVASFYSLYLVLISRPYFLIVTVKYGRFTK